MSIMGETRLRFSPVRELLDPRGRTRLIGVGVRDADHDAATIGWAVAEANPGVDLVHIAHAYSPIMLPGCAWDPVTRARDARYVAGKHITAQAVQRGSQQHTGVQIDGSAIAGSPADVLEELSDVVDLIVIGDDAQEPTLGAKMSWRVQDVARCPVVCVPPGPHPSRDLPVTVVVDEHGICEPVIRFAADAARRRDVTLQISCSWTSLHANGGPAPLSLAEQQEQLDAQLASWRSGLKNLAIVARIELDDGWLDHLRAHSSLLVSRAGSAPSLRFAGGTVGPNCPTATVLDCE
jgi:hypothetical protein